MSNTNMVLGSWRLDEWPEYVTVSHDGMREPGRRYVPERTCRITETRRKVSQTQTMVTKACSACGHVFGSEETRPFLPGLEGTITVRKVDVPNYCQNCGAKVVNDDADR